MGGNESKIYEGHLSVDQYRRPGLNDDEIYQLY